MRELLPSTAMLLFLCFAVRAQEPATDQADAADETQVQETQGDGVKSPKTLSGMSILGNEEAPKSLVIIPWKSSELGDDISLSDTLVERARPVDKEVFLRELEFYEIRSGKEPAQQTE